MERRKDSFSLVVPVFNSNQNLLVLANDFEKIFIKEGYEAELIFVDDASEESTRSIAEQVARKKNFVKTIRLKKNSGQIAATTCGIYYATGQFIITMDDDLQYPMKEVLRLISHHQRSGKKIVFGFPHKRMHSFGHRFAALLVMWLFDFVIMPKYRKINFYTTFRIFDRSLFFDNDNGIISRHLFYLWEIPVKDMDSIPVEHQVRKIGSSTYTPIKHLKHLLPQLLITVFRLSLISLLTVIIIAIVLFSFISVQLILITLIIFLFVCLITVAGVSHVLLERKRMVKYEIEKIT